MWLSTTSRVSGGGTNSHRTLTPTGTAVPVEEDEPEPLEPCPVFVVRANATSDKPLSLGELPITTCGDLQSFTALLVGGTDMCKGLQSLGPYCGCTKPPNSCSLLS